MIQRLSELDKTMVRRLREQFPAVPQFVITNRIRSLTSTERFGLMCKLFLEPKQ